MKDDEKREILDVLAELYSISSLSTKASLEYKLAKQEFDIEMQELIVRRKYFSEKRKETEQKFLELTSHYVEDPELMVKPINQRYLEIYDIQALKEEVISKLPPSSRHLGLRLDTTMMGEIIGVLSKHLPSALVVDIDNVMKLIGEDILEIDISIAQIKTNKIVQIPKKRLPDLLKDAGVKSLTDSTEKAIEEYKKHLESVQEDGIHDTYPQE